MLNKKSAVILAIAIGLTGTIGVAEAKGATDFGAYSWNVVNGNASWSPRAGLQAVELRNRLYIMGGRTPRPPVFPPIPGTATSGATCG